MIQSNYYLAFRDGDTYEIRNVVMVNRSQLEFCLISV